jgi:transcriptional regulator with XRE-family HTH domain
VGATTRALDRAARTAERQARALADELRERRISLALSQTHVAASARLSRTRYGLIERGRSTAVTLEEINDIAAVLGLSPSIRLYPDGAPIRDAGHAARLSRVLEAVRPPLTYRIEVPLARTTEFTELRAWDAMIFGAGKRTAIELEMRLADVQAVLRHIDLKRRDDPTEAFLLLVADTRHNRRVLAEFGALFAALPRLRPSAVRGALVNGRHPPTGLLLA